MKQLLLIILSVFLAFHAHAQAPVNTNASGVFIDGYDVVAYFTQSKAVKGSSAFQLQRDGVTMFFESEANRSLFQNNPDAYYPQFQGHCANGLSDGHLVRANPEIFRIIDGKLYLFYSWWGKAQWKFDQQEQITLANDYWNKVNQ